MTVALVLMAGAALIGVAGPACLGPTVRPSLLPAAALATWLGALLAFLVLTTLSATLLLFPHVLDTSGVRTLVGGCLSGTVPHSSFGTLVQLGISLLPSLSWLGSRSWRFGACAPHAVAVPVTSGCCGRRPVAPVKSIGSTIRGQSPIASAALAEQWWPLTESATSANDNAPQSSSTRWRTYAAGTMRLCCVPISPQRHFRCCH